MSKNTLETISIDSLVNVSGGRNVLAGTIYDPQNIAAGMVVTAKGLERAGKGLHDIDDAVQYAKTPQAQAAQNCRLYGQCGQRRR